MNTRVRFTVTDRAGRTTTATGHFLDDAAPGTVRRFKAALPITETLRHVRWSGEAGYVLVGSLRDEHLQPENKMSFFCRGTIGFRPEHGEVTIAYGSAQARDWWGIGWTARIAELDGDSDAFLDAVRGTQAEGAKQLVISAEEG